MKIHGYTEYTFSFNISRCSAKGNLHNNIVITIMMILCTDLGIWYSLWMYLVVINIAYYTILIVNYCC